MLEDMEGRMLRSVGSMQRSGLSKAGECVALYSHNIPFGVWIEVLGARGDHPEINPLGVSPRWLLRSDGPITGQYLDSGFQYSFLRRYLGSLDSTSP